MSSFRSCSKEQKCFLNKIFENENRYEFSKKKGFVMCVSKGEDIFMQG